MKLSEECIVLWQYLCYSSSRAGAVTAWQVLNMSFRFDFSRKSEDRASPLKF